MSMKLGVARWACFGRMQVKIFEWVGKQTEYPPPGPGDNAAGVGPVVPYFAKAGAQIHGDTFPMTWADDGEIYASAGDPNWGGKEDGLDVEKYSGLPPHYTIRSEEHTS